MRTKKPKRRYETANEIRDEIDRQLAKARKFLETAEAYEQKAEMLRQDGGPWVEDAKFAMVLAGKARRSANRIKEKKLTVLKDKLAEWGTEPMKGVIPDRSVQA